MLSNDSSTLNPYDYLGLEHRQVRLAPYSPYWPAIFQKEKMRLAEVLAPLPFVAEHIGSTAVKGMCAKPIVDAAVGIPPGQNWEAYRRRLERLGYTHHGEKGVPGRQFFSAGEPCLFHIHLVELDSELWKNHLLFRDYLRAQPSVARQYEQLKIRLAEQFRHDRDSYTCAKADFINTTLANARDERK